jgi:hypothetical protein
MIQRESEPFGPQPRQGSESRTPYLNGPVVAQIFSLRSARLVIY